MSFLAGEFLPTFDDHITIEFIDLHQECVTIGLLTAHESRSTTAEKVQDVFTRFGGILDAAHGQFDGFLRQMHHGLWVDLLDMPKVCGIVGLVEMMTGSFDRRGVVAEIGIASPDKK